ncbi:MAG: hypothetical protein JKY65_22200 [Planctomycetes bacterium]|nr:hypothetical protein [Planctomycetota bacterium]
MNLQAERLRALAKAQQGRRDRDQRRPHRSSETHPRAGRLAIPSVALLSGQTGVGRTSLAIGLSIFLAKAARVTLVDLGRGDVARTLGLADADPVRLSVRGRRPFAGARVEACPGLQILSGSAHRDDVREPAWARTRRLVDQLNELSGHTDVVALDLDSCWRQETYDLACSATLGLLVMTPDAPAVTAGFALYKRFMQDQAGPAIGLVINMATPVEGARVGEGLAQVARRFQDSDLPLFGVIPYDPGLAAARAAREPYATHSPLAPASRAFAQLARRVQEALTPHDKVSQ